ncbi:hypothetical protein VTI28DRAFT_4095 [Corynascus sepedonium]
MGRLCSFDNSNVRRESLSVSWKLCLECLSRYTGLSSVANKSFCLLQESARRLLPQDQQILLPLSSSSPDSPSQVLRTGMMPYGDNGGSPSLLARFSNSDGCQEQRTQGAFSTSAPVSLSGGDGTSLGNEGNLAADVIWPANDPLGTSYWPFMPFLSQLESFQQQDFNASNLES